MLRLWAHQILDFWSQRTLVAAGKNIATDEYIHIKESAIFRQMGALSTIEN